MRKAFGGGQKFEKKSYSNVILFRQSKNNNIPIASGTAPFFLYYAFLFRSLEIISDL